MDEKYKDLIKNVTFLDDKLIDKLRKEVNSRY